MEKLKKSLLENEGFKSRLMKLMYISLSLAIFNSSLHMNFNVIIGFLILFVITKYYICNPNHCIKLIFQLSILGIIIDKIKLIIISIFYLQDLYISNEYWAELQTQITIYYYVNVLETIINILFLLLCYYYYKENFSMNSCLSELIKIEYYDFENKEAKEESSIN